MNISPRIKKDLKSYYVAKKYEGRIISPVEMRQIFKTKNFFSIKNYFDYVHKPGQTFYKIKICSLVEKNHAIQFLNLDPKNGLWQLWDNHITGTNLYTFDDDKIPFWRLRKYGYRRRWLPNDIEERHINRTVKNYQQVIHYLKTIKQNCSNAVQLKLFE